MPKDTPGAILSESPTDETVEAVSPSDEGKSPQKSTEQLLKELKAENKRKGSELEELREQVQELKAVKEERLEELQEKSRLSTEDKAEMLSLEQEIAYIEKNPGSKPWLELNKRESKKSAREELETYDYENALGMIEDLSEIEKIPQAEFEKKIKPFLRAYYGELPTKKVKRAYKDYLKQKEVDLKLAKLSERDDVQRESGDRVAQPQSKRELFDRAKKTGSFAEILKHVAGEQSETYNK
jgi:vacuolar-type H+-ATPase subunit I/STV1